MAFHRIVADEQPYFIPPMALSLKTFSRLINYLRKFYTIIGLNQIIPVIDGDSSKNGRFLCLTFDDGYRDNFEVAVPILKRFGLPATFFVPVQQIDREEPYWWDYLYEVYRNNVDGFRSWLKSVDSKLSHMIDHDPKDQRINLPRNLVRHLNWYSDKDRERFLGKMKSHFGPYSGRRQLMSWAELNRLSMEGFSIGSHCISHIPLTDLSSDTAKKEIFLSKLILERRIKATVKGFSYPRGSYKTNHVRMVQQAGYSYAVTTKFSSNRRDCNRFTLARRNVSDFYGLRSLIPVGMHLLETTGWLDPLLTNRR
ncbi:MAG: polysaccharide deacetylase family protein [Chitinivibrionales bacterium]|nr:polysaccharide deacetylase family protein [Chitinivibrionales bacterium]